VSDRTYVDALYENMTKPVAIGDRTFIPPHWIEHRREVAENKPPVVGTLSSFAEFVMTATLDAAVRRDVFVHVQDPEHVAFRSSVEIVEGDRYRRNTILMASTDMVGRPTIQSGTFYDPETFNVGLQAWFVDDASRGAILAAVGNLRDSAVTTSVDDGVTQEVVAARGVMVQRANLPNPVTLRPYRTFREVTQPASTFILRARPGREGQLPTLALFDADGMAWKLEAIKNVAAWLRGQKITVPVLA